MFTPCSSLQDFITSLDYYINPPVKRQRVDEKGEAKKITLPSLNSFLEINKEWMPLAKADATARAKFRELAERFKTSTTRSSQQVSKRLREEGVPELPQEMLLAILNSATDQPKKWVPEYEKLSLVNSQWEPLAIRALAEKINREKISIIDLNMPEIWTDYVFLMGPLITHLDLKGLAISQDELNKITKYCTHLTYLTFDGNEEISLDLSLLIRLKELVVYSVNIIKLNNCPSLEILDLSVHHALIPSMPSLKRLKIYHRGHELTLPEMPSLEDLTFSSFANKCSLPTFPSLRKLKLWLPNVNEIHFQTQPELQTLELQAQALTRLVFSDLTNLAIADLDIPQINTLNFKHLHKLENLSINSNELTHFNLSDSVKHLKLEVSQRDLSVESLTLESLSIISFELRTLRLGKFDKLEMFNLFSKKIERLTLPLFPNIKDVNIYCPQLSIFNFQSISKAKFLTLNAPKLMLQLTEPFVCEEDQQATIVTKDYQIDI